MQLSLLPVAAGQASDEGEQTELTLLVYLAAYPWEQIWRRRDQIRKVIMLPEETQGEYLHKSTVLS